VPSRTLNEDAGSRIEQVGRFHLDLGQGIAATAESGGHIDSDQCMSMGNPFMLEALPLPAEESEMKNVLVVYYSRSGHARRVAEVMAKLLKADIEEIQEARNRGGGIGFLRSVIESLLSRKVRINPARHAPGLYETVVIGTPVWAAHVSSPVRSYLLQHASELKQVGLFCTMGGSGGEEVLAEMAALLSPDDPEAIEHGRFPTLAIADGELETVRRRKINGFVKLLKARNPSLLPVAV
jgi:flavodoxin